MKEVVEEIFAVDPPSRSVIKKRYPDPGERRVYQNMFAKRTIIESLSRYEELKKYMANLDSYDLYQLKQIDNLVTKFESESSLLTGRGFRVINIINAVDQRLKIPRLSAQESHENIKNPFFLREVIKRNFQQGRRDILAGTITLIINDAEYTSRPKTPISSQEFPSILSSNLDLSLDRETK